MENCLTEFSRVWAYSPYWRMDPSAEYGCLNGIRTAGEQKRPSNWLHVGSERTGPRVDAILSVVETSRRHNIPIRHYFSSVLPGLGEFPANRVSELTVCREIR